MKHKNKLVPEKVLLNVDIQKNGRLKKAQARMLTMLTIIDAVCLKNGIDYWLDRGTLLGTMRHKGFIPWDDDIDIAMPRSSFNKFLQLDAKEIPEGLYRQTFQTDPGYFNLAAPLKIRDLNSRFIEKYEQGNETYHQGIFIDVFPYDIMPEHYYQYKAYKWIAKKTLRLLAPKRSALLMGHHAKIYYFLGKFFSRITLEKVLRHIICRANLKKTGLIGYGFDSTKNSYFKEELIYPLKRAQFESATFNIPNQPEVMLTTFYGNYQELPPKNERIPCHCRELSFSLKHKAEVFDFSGLDHSEK